MMKNGKFRSNMVRLTLCWIKKLRGHFHTVCFDKMEPPATAKEELTPNFSNLPNHKVFRLNMMTSSNENIFRVTGHLCGEFAGPGEFPAQRPVTRSFGIFFDLRPNKRLSKQPWGWSFEWLYHFTNTDIALRIDSSKKWPQSRLKIFLSESGVTWTYSNRLTDLIEYIFK